MIILDKRKLFSKLPSVDEVLGDSKIRPNQLFALSLTYPVIEADSEEAKNIISVKRIWHGASWFLPISNGLWSM